MKYSSTLIETLQYLPNGTPVLAVKYWSIILIKLAILIVIFILYTNAFRQAKDIIPCFPAVEAGKLLPGVDEGSMKDNEASMKHP